MQIELVMAWPRRHRSLRLELPGGSTLEQALQRAGWGDIPDVEAYAVFGVVAGVNRILEDGDRIELLRPLQADPKDARRRRAAGPPG